MTRQERKSHRAAHNNPINVTVFVGKIRKVISYEDYKRDYLDIGTDVLQVNPPEEEVEVGT